MKAWSILDVNKQPFLILNDVNLARKIIKACPELQAEKIEVDDEEFVVDGGKLVARKENR